VLIDILFQKILGSKKYISFISHEYKSLSSDLEVHVHAIEGA
jgi:hypothetical protein